MVIKMKKFVQIENSRVHWIFEAEEKPEFAPNIVLVEITGKDEIREEWDYDEATGEFTEPVYVEPEPEPLPDTTIEEYILDIDFRVCNLELGL